MQDRCGPEICPGMTPLKKVNIIHKDMGNYSKIEFKRD